MRVISILDIKSNTLIKYKKYLKLIDNLVYPKTTYTNL